MSQVASRRMRVLTLGCVLVLAAVVVAGCTSATLPTETPGITGDITYLAIPTSAVAVATITVEGGTQPTGAVSDKAVVTVTKKTGIFDESGKKASVDQLQVGTSVKVWFTGPVAESYPVQGAASAVQITGIAAK